MTYFPKFSFKEKIPFQAEDIIRSHTEAALRARSPSNQRIWRAQCRMSLIGELINLIFFFFCLRFWSFDNSLARPSAFALFARVFLLSLVWAWSMMLDDVETKNNTLPGWAYQWSLSLLVPSNRCCFLWPSSSMFTYHYASLHCISKYYRELFCLLQHPHPKPNRRRRLRNCRLQRPSLQKTNEKIRAK